MRTVKEFHSVRIIMNLSYSSFSKNKQTKFIEDLSTMTGCPVEEFRKITFSRGCVIFEGEMDSQAALLIYQNYKIYKALSDEQKMSEDFSKIRELVESYKITEIDQGPIWYVNIVPEVDDHKNAVMFVHGWRGDKDSFGSLPTYLSENSNIVSRIYEYPTGLWTKSDSLETISNDIENWFLNNTTSDKRKVALIGHSMGGLLIRRMLANQTYREKPIKEKLKQVTFIASPFSGVNWARVAMYIPTLRKKQLRELTSDSGFLIGLKAAWNHWRNNNSPSNCQFNSIYAQDDKVVTVASAMGDDANAIPILNRGHLNIVEPQLATDTIVLTLNRFLSETKLK